MRSRRGEFTGGLFRGAGIGVGAALAFLTTALLAVTISGTLRTDFAAGETISASALNTNFNSLKTAIEGLPDCSEYAAALHESGAQTLTSGAGTQLTSVTEVLDVGGLHTAGDPGRFTVTQAGRYYLTAHVYFDGNPTGNRFASITHNGTVVSAIEVPAVSTGAATQLSLSGMANMAAGESAILIAQQGSGAGLGVSQLRFSIFRICGN